MLVSHLGLLTLLFARSSRIHKNHSRVLIAVQSKIPTLSGPSFSTFYCKTLNIFIKVCSSLPCLFKLLALSLEVSPGPIPAVFILSARFDPLLLLNV